MKLKTRYYESRNFRRRDGNPYFRRVAAQTQADGGDWWQAAPLAHHENVFDSWLQ